jgi:hypothetical protein
MDLEALRRHLDEDERVARAAIGHYGGGRDWVEVSPNDHPGLVGDMKGDVVTFGQREGGGTWQPRAEHIARHDPARVLRWVRAAREILDRHRKITTSFGAETCDQCYEFGHLGYPCQEVESLMSVYGDTDG